ncbi:MAG: molybdopterin-dependent oxidoreductase [Deltaproteobacteria bacterium]|nr:molybdopterin-dependent oxidoreductase [Deltaproteobacteria bacterium]
MKFEKKKVTIMEEKKHTLSRRTFLKIVGQTSVVGAVGCGNSSAQKVLPLVKGSEDTIPGKSVWFNTTCTECDAACGIQVKTRDGRAIKIEGNPDHPINKGGVCAIGHSALQNTYDPDRIRQPLERADDGSYKPVSWKKAYAAIAKGLKAKGQKAYLGSSQTGALSALLSDWCKAFDLTQIDYSGVSNEAEAKAAELVFGSYGIPTYHFDKAEAVLNFGTDFLETWVSPCEYARGWADTRRSNKPCRVIHVEPRLSLTAGNADTWLQSNPGTEVQVALAVLKVLVERGQRGGADAGTIEQIKKLTEHVTVESAALASGVSSEKILIAAEHLINAKRSIVLAGGASTATSNPLPLMVAANLMNLVLGNVGRTVNIASSRKPSSNSLDEVSKLISTMQKGKLEVLFIDGSNPSFNLPPSFDFIYALKKVPLIVSFASHMDETTGAAHLILPTHTALESWGDAEPLPGVHNLIQPTMKPVFDTQAFGDILLASADKAGKKMGEDFLSYLKDAWQKVHANAATGKSFKNFWLESVERGGFIRRVSANSTAQVSSKAFALDFSSAHFEEKDGHTLVLYPFPSVRSFDGRAANRPWLSEIPDPVSQVAWDSWAEIHPDSAKAHGLAQGDKVTIRNHYGEITVNVLINRYIHKDIIAVPIGHGHTGYGRFAKGIGGNVMQLLPALASKDVGAVSLLSTKVNVTRGRGKGDIVNLQGSDYQMNRHLARTAAVATAVHATNGHAEGHDAHADESHGESNGHGGHHEPKQMYVQREHPLYKWGMAVDLAACTGCSACVVACYAENNIPCVGKKVVSQGREMSWLRIERYYGEAPSEELSVNFMPMMCQQCGHAPCEPVCPVYATYHNEEGLNVMVYNRCVGTRYCSNNCSYKVRHYNWIQVDFPEPLNWQLNPDVTPRSAGVMEKCTFCLQRINEGKDNAKDLGRKVRDGEIKPACVQSCPTQALTFGDLNDPHSEVSKRGRDKRAYKVLDHHLNTQPAVSYLENIKYEEV